MKKTIIIIGMGPGLSLGIAEKFGAEGFTVGMISRNKEKLQSYTEHLTTRNIESHFEEADVADTAQLLHALQKLRIKTNGVDLMIYNAVDYRMKPILEENIDDLTTGFKISVANALAATKELLEELSAKRGCIILTGGSTATHPNPDLASISLGKAGIKNLTLQLHQVLKSKGVFVGTISIGGWIQKESTTHSPTILAEKFWELYSKQDMVELNY
jgi:NADP-dependent 3-hydroxy acid dehydrogenase YdfG